MRNELKLCPTQFWIIISHFSYKFDILFLFDVFVYFWKFYTTYLDHILSSPTTPSTSSPSLSLSSLSPVRENKTTKQSIAHTHTQSHWGHICLCQLTLDMGPVLGCSDTETVTLKMKICNILDLLKSGYLHLHLLIFNIMKGFLRIAFDVVCKALCTQ